MSRHTEPAPPPSNVVRFPSHVAVKVDSRAALIHLLNVDLAATADLYYQVKQAHWNVKGAQFFARHELFDKLATKLTKVADAIAERAATLGGYVNGTLRLTAEATPLDEYDLQAIDGRAHVQALVERYTTYCTRLRKDIGRSTDELEDPVTADLLT